MQCFELCFIILCPSILATVGKLSEAGHPSKYKPGSTLINFVDQTDTGNHHAMPPTKSTTEAKYEDQY